MPLFLIKIMTIQNKLQDIAEGEDGEGHANGVTNGNGVSVGA